MNEKMSDSHNIERKLISNKVSQIPSSAIHEMTRLAVEVKDPAFLSWARPTLGTPEHINQAAYEAIRKGLVSGYSPSTGILNLRTAIVKYAISLGIR